MCATVKKTKWLYIGKENRLSQRAGSLARLGHPLDVYYSNRINIELNGYLDSNWSEFEQWVRNKYAKTYSPTVLCYVRKYKYLIFGNLKELDFLTDSTKATVVKALIILSKFLGIHQQFRNRLLDYGVKIHRQDSFTSFLRILNANNTGNDILNWYREAQSNARDNEKTLLKFLLYSGLRKEEAIMSFCRIIDLHKENRLSEYYNEELDCLMHFKYPKQFIRKTKNVFITFVSSSLISEIASSIPVSYQSIVKRLRRKKIRCRINELRDFYGTYLLHKGILEQEVNLLQGRIPPSIFIKHYWSPKLSELRDRVLKAIEPIEKELIETVQQNQN